MLNLNEISQRIQNPSLCKFEELADLKLLCEKYPYSQVFVLLYLKTLAQNNDVGLDIALQQYAYRIADRSVLFDLLNYKTQSTNLPSLPDEVLEELGLSTTRGYSLEEEEKKLQIETFPSKNQDSLPTKNVAEVQKPTENVPKVDISPSKLSFLAWIDQGLEKPVTEKTNSSTIIQRFIEDEPKINVRDLNAIEKEVPDNALNSIDDSRLPVSETLARIFETQGNISKAISTYRQLILVFPEKKHIFSDKIEELTKKLHT